MVRRIDLHTDKNSAVRAGRFSLRGAFGLHRNTGRPGEARDDEAESGATSAIGQLNFDTRSSLLKTARPFRGSPHRCGKGAAVSGDGSNETLRALATKV